MTAYTLSAIAYGLCLLALPWALTQLGRLIHDAHLRGMARVHEGQSWEPRVPRQRDAA